MASVRKREWEYKGVKKSAWEVRYVDGSGKHRSKSFERKKEAEAYRSTVETEMNSGQHAAESRNVTVKELCKAFELHQQQRCEDGAIGKTFLLRISAVIRLHVIPSIGAKKLADVNLATLTVLIDDLRTTKKLAPATVRFIARNIYGMFEFAVRREWVAKNPAEQLRDELKGMKTKPIETFTTEQIRSILSAADTHAEEAKGNACRTRQLARCFVNLAAFCGMRLGEIRGLKVENLDLENDVVKVRNSLSYKDGLKSPKTRAGVRNIGLPKHLSAMLKDWLEVHAVKNKMGLVFTFASGIPINSSYVYTHQWGSILHRAGLTKDPKYPEYHFHALRHFAASWRIDAGMPLPVVAREMGHNSFDMTLSVYTHVISSIDGDARAANDLANRLFTAA